MPEVLPVGWDITQVVTIIVVGVYALGRFIWRDVQTLLARRNGGTFETKALMALDDLTVEVRGMRADLTNGLAVREQLDRTMQAELTNMAQQATRDITEVVDRSAAKLDVLLDRGR